MIKGKLWNQISVLELTKKRPILRKSRMSRISSSRLEFFPTALPSTIESKYTTTTISPENKLIISFEFISITIILFQAFYIPFILAFELDDNMFWFQLDTALTFYFIFDIFLSFNTAIYKDGSLITDRKAISKAYLKKWFLIDLLAVSPYMFIPLPKPEGYPNSTIRYFKILRLIKLLRLTKLNKLMQNIREHISSRLIATFLMLFEIMCIEFFFAHILACVFYSIAISENTHTPYVWLNTCYLESSTIIELYTTALYWSITTLSTVGYGDIKPQTQSEILFVVFAMIFACIMFGYVIGSIEGVIMDYTALSTRHREMIVAMNSFMKRQNLPAALRYKVRRYMDFVYETQTEAQVDESEILGFLNTDLRELVCIYSRGYIFNGFPAFSKFSQKFLKKITMVIKFTFYSPFDVIFEEGEKSRDVFFIQTGEAILEDENSKCVIKQLRRLEHFGEIAFFLAVPRCCTAKAKDFMETLTLVWKEFAVIMAEDLEAQEYLNRLYSQEFILSLEEIKVECYICKRFGHIAKICEELDFGKSEKLKEWIDRRGDPRKLKINQEIKEKIIYPQFMNFRPKNSKKYNVQDIYNESSKELVVKKSMDYSIYSDSSDSLGTGSVGTSWLDSTLYKTLSYHN